MIVYHSRTLLYTACYSSMPHSLKYVQLYIAQKLYLQKKMLVLTQDREIVSFRLHILSF